MTKKSKLFPFILTFLAVSVLVSSCELFLDSATLVTQNNSYRAATVTIDGETKTIPAYSSKQWTIYFDFGDSSKYIVCRATFYGLSGSLVQYYTIYPYGNYLWKIDSQ